MAYKCPFAKMKKTTFMMFFVALFCLCFTSCSKDDDETNGLVTITPPIVYMYHDDTKQLSATNATNWSTEDDFIAEVDKNGLVTGRHIGTTNIIATNGKKSAKCEVTIMPKYNLYDTPILDWGTSMTELRNKETHEYVQITSTSSATSLAYDYTSDSDNPCIVMYNFKNNELYMISVILKWDYFPLATEHIMERYQAMYVDRVKQYAIFGDAYTKDKMKTIVHIELTKVSGSLVLVVSYIDASIASSEPIE